MKQFHPLLKGAFELHCHSYPSIFPRKQTDWMLVEDVDEAGMAGVLLKSHEAPTADRATLIRDKYPHLHVYGGLACNYFTGGLSPPAVDVAIRSGAKIIWMPTFSSKVHQAHFAQKKTPFFSNERPLTHPAQGLEVWDDKHRIKAEVHEILSLIGNADIILATGHISPAEVARVTPYDEGAAEVAAPVQWNRAVKHYSYAMLDIHADPDNATQVAEDAKGRGAEWRATLNSQAIVLSDRNTGTDADQKVQSIHTDDPGDWRGSVLWNDNHVAFESSQYFETKFGEGGLIDGTDNLFADNDAPPQDRAGYDALMVTADHNIVHSGLVGE